jgi:ABC-2 type transport system permease protein
VASIKHVWFIALKDLRLFATDRMALMWALLFPFFFVLLFNFILAGVGTADNRLVLHMATQETGGLSTQIIQSLETADVAQLKPGEPQIIWDKDYQAAYQAVQNKKRDGFIAFPADFTEGVYLGYGTRIEVVADSAATDTRAVLNSLAQTIASHVSAQQVATNASVGLIIEQASANPADLSGLSAKLAPLFTAQNAQAVRASLISFQTENIGEVKNINPSNYVIPGYLVMFVFFTAALAAEDIVRERQNRTLERLLASSVRRESILGGEYLGTVIKGLIQLTVFWVVGILAFQLDIGVSPAGIVALSLLMVLMSSAFALMLATLVRTQRAASSLAVLLALVLAPLGGCWWPLFITPQWMQFLAKITPHGWANSGFNKLMVFGGGFSSIVPEITALAVFTLVFAGMAVWRFRARAG